MPTPYNTAERLVRYQDRATQAHAAGFASEAKRKEALDFVNRAYETARDLFHEELRTQFPYDETARSWPQAYLTASDVAPYGLHQWRRKHADQLAGYPDFVAKVASLVALRDGIKGQALAAKQPAPKTTAKAAKEAAQMTCQVCGRGIFAEAGVIAHHGYQRPHEGYQTASCPGARELPFEVTRDVLVQHLVGVAEEIDRLTKIVAQALIETAPAPINWTGREYDRVLGRYPEKVTWTTRANFDAKLAEIVPQARTHPYVFDFDTVKEHYLRVLRGHLDRVERYHEEQTQRVNAWTQTHRAGDAGEAAWVVL